MGDKATADKCNGRVSRHLANGATITNLEGSSNLPISTVETMEIISMEVGSGGSSNGRQTISGVTATSGEPITNGEEAISGVVINHIPVNIKTTRNGDLNSRPGELNS